MKRFTIILLVVLSILATTTQAQATPAGAARIAVADCHESVILWENPTYPGIMSGTYAYVTFDASWHGKIYPVGQWYQYYHTLANGRAVYRAINWQPFSLNAQSMTVTGGDILGPFGAPLEPIQSGQTFTMNCDKVFIPILTIDN